MTLLWLLGDKLEKLLRSYSSFQDLLSHELTISKNFPNCFVNKAILEAIKSIKFSFDNNRHVITCGNEGSGKTQLPLWFSEWYSNERNINKDNIFYCLCKEELKFPDLNAPTIMQAWHFFGSIIPRKGIISKGI